MDYTFRYLKFAILGLIAACVGCQVEGDQFKRVQATSNHAVIYVYRPYQITSASLEPQITCGHSTIAIGPSGYHTFVEEPGDITCFASSDASSKIQFETR